MAAIGFKSAKCKDCYKCVRICPVKAIHTDAEHVRYVADECILVRPVSGSLPAECDHQYQRCVQSQKLY